MTLHAEVRDDRCILTLDRVDRRNALTGAMLAAIRDAVRAARTPVLILTGAGPVFSAGADLDEIRAGTLATAPVWSEAADAIAAYPGLTIAALNGTCAGGAVGLMLAADLRIARPGAEIFYPVMRLGHLPQPGDGPRLAALAGPSRAARLVLAGARIGADTALHWGLVDWIADDPMAEAFAWSKDAAAAPAGHAASVKAVLRGG